METTAAQKMSAGRAEGLFTAKELPKYSVLMSVYAKDTPKWFEEAIESMASQSAPPEEIVIIEDGPISEELHNAERRCEERHPNLIRRIPLPQNIGLGGAMRYGVGVCKCEWIARMDADDVSDPNRCKEELLAAEATNADIVGCDCEEFIGTIQNSIAKRLFPETHEELVRFSRRRAPFCHPAVMMKKSVVLRVGNYHSVYPHEDYDLFVRMLASGAIGCTVKKVLFHVRASKDFYRRRGGVRYMRTLVGFNVQLLRSGWMSPKDFVVRSCANIVVGLSPVAVRTWLYKKLLRK